MGLDLYIEARIRDKKTKRLISCDKCGEYVTDRDKGFFEICWWCSHLFEDVRVKMIEICNKHAKANYTYLDYVIPIPQTALREIQAYLVKRSYLPKEEEFEVLPCNIEWQERASYEKMNLVNANKLHDLLWTLQTIKYDNDICIENIEKLCVPDEKDRKHLKENPQAYEWEFRIFNSY
ncbi:MAG: hypothetical protein IJF07_06470 [Lachnospiraceae bacterium]|nr:hypothetical protein [Lachnospiraceae bacterium]